MRTNDGIPPDAAGVAPRLATAEARLVRIPFRRPFVTATSEFTHRRSWIVRVWNRDGRLGAGEAGLDPAASDAALASLSRLVREAVPRLVSGDIPSPGELSAEGEPGRALRAGIEAALEGLATPPSRASKEVAVNAVIGFGGPDAGAEAAAQAVEVGFRTLTLHAGNERETDVLVERVRAVRHAVGPEPRLRLDVGGAWDLETASERLAAVARFRIEYVSQPLAAWDLAGHAALRERGIVPVALDQSIDSEGAAREALANDAADVVVLRPGRIGGPNAVRSIAVDAVRGGLGVVVGTWYETGVGVAAALHAAGRLPGDGRAGSGDGGPRAELAHALATGGVLVHDLLVAPLPIVDGRMPVPPTISIDEEALEDFTVEAVEATI